MNKSNDTDHMISMEIVKDLSPKKPTPKDDMEISMDIMNEEIEEDKKTTPKSPSKKQSPTSSPKKQSPKKELNANKRWTAEEEKKLLDNLKTLSIKDTASEHKRTDGGIRQRLKKIAIEMHNNNKSVKEISKLTKLTEEAINKAIESLTKE